MAYDETFRYRERIPEEEVYRLTGKIAPIVELQPNGFEGPLADWAQRRNDVLGETIVPRYVTKERIDGSPHHIAWIYRAGQDRQTDESYEYHHIACDCSPRADELNDWAHVFLCEGVFRAIRRRAYQINTFYGMEKAFDYFKTDKEDLGLSPNGRVFLQDTIMELLKYDHLHPEGWMANTVAGVHHVKLLSYITQQHPKYVTESVISLQSGGSVIFDDGTVRLVA